jgi:hypothetical protein
MLYVLTMITPLPPTKTNYYKKLKANQACSM